MGINIFSFKQFPWEGLSSIICPTVLSSLRNDAMPKASFACLLNPKQNPKNRDIKLINQNKKTPPTIHSWDELNDPWEKPAHINYPGNFIQINFTSHVKCRNPKQANALFKPKSMSASRWSDAIHEDNLLELKKSTDRWRCARDR